MDNRNFFWVGISGLPGRPSIGLGKSTLATALLEALDQRDLGARIIPMATGVKFIASLQNHSLRAAQVYGTYRTWGHPHGRALDATRATLSAFRKYPSRTGQKNRPLLQTLGTEVGRDIFGDGAWVDLVERLGNASDAAVVISDDIRFDNEARAVDLLVGIDPSMAPAALEQNRLDLVARTPGMDYSYFQVDHRSEQALTQWPDWRMAPRWTPDALTRLAEYVALSVQSRSVHNPF